MIPEKSKYTEETWDCIAQSFDRTRRNPWQPCIDFINTFSNRDVVVDIGCGNGRHLLPAAQQCQQAIGIDISRKLLCITQEKLSQKNLTNVGLLHANAVHLPLKNEIVDAVLYIASLHNIKGKDQRIRSLEEVKRVLKTNGRALISVWSRWQDKYRKQFFKQWFIQNGKMEFGDIDIYWRQHGLDIPRFYHLYSKREFFQDIQRAGLEIEETRDVNMRSKKHPDNYFAWVKKS